MASNPLEYFIGKGILSWTPDGGTIRDLGNVPEFEITPEIEKLPHFSSRTGVRSKDRDIVVEKSAQVRVVLEEWTSENLAMALMSEVETDTGGTEKIDIFSLSEIKGALSFEGTNDIGAKFDILLPNVSFIPSGTVGFITDEFGQLELTGDILIDGAGSFGTITKTADAA